MFQIPYHNSFFSTKQTNFLTTLETQDSGGYILNSKYLKKKEEEESDASVLFTAAKLFPLPQSSQFLFNKDEIILCDEYKTLTTEKDRLSNLPESLIVHILAFLVVLYNTRDVICTSVLSRRWGKLWTSVLYLHFQCMRRCYMPGVVDNTLRQYRGKKLEKFSVHFYVIEPHYKPHIDR